MTQAVYEIALATGFGYVSILCTHPTYGDVLGVDTAIHETRLKDPGTFTFDQIVIFPLEAAVTSRTVIAQHIGDRPVSDNTPIIFKFAVRDRAGDPIYWWLWDGDQIKLADANEDLDALPERRVLSPRAFLGVWE